MRVLFTSYPLYGHVNPMLPLALAFGRLGHEVAFATGPDLVDVVSRHGLQAWAAGPTHARSAGSGPPSAAFFIDAAGPRAADLVPRAAGWKPDLVVTDEFDLAGPVAAAVCGARHVVHGLGPMPPAPVWDPLEAALDDLLARWRAPARAADLRAALYLEPCPPSVRPAGPRVRTRTQPLRPVAGPPDPAFAWPAGLDALPHPRTVHLTLGTLFTGHVHLLREAVTGVRELPVNLVVTTGPGIPPDVLGPQPAHVVAAPYLPHTQLLPRVHAVVSQGGAGVFFGALAHGLPQLLLPLGADQFLNAEAARRTGAALVLPPQDRSAPTVRDAVRRILADPGFASVADRIRGEIAAMPAADDVAALLTRTTEDPR